MHLRTFTLLVVIYGVAHARTVHDCAKGLNGVEMITTPRKHVLSYEEEIKGKMVQQESLAEQWRSNEAHDCEDLIKMGTTSDGVYIIYVEGRPIKVYCDMINGGWIVLQKRTDDTVDYERNFVDYVHGFGDVSGEHWLGLDRMHLLTRSERGHWIVHFHLGDSNGDIRWAEYSEFRISDGPDYTLTFDEDSHRGTLSDTHHDTPDNTSCEYVGLSYHNGARFSAKNVDRDESSGNCANNTHGTGGWWFRNCYAVLTTGAPYDRDDDGWYAIKWNGWNKNEPLKSAIIKIKRKSYPIIPFSL